MRQNKQSVSLPVNFRRWLVVACVACLFGLVAVAHLERARAQQPAATPAQKSRTKRITPLRTSDTTDGSRVTITSDAELNDYSAYRSGDRFIVVVPQAEGAGAGGARGRGFEGAQVERRGKDLVYTFKLQPGATARVNQRFNRLDVQFSAGKGANANTANAKPSPTPTRRTLAEEAGITKPPANVNAQPTPDTRRTPDANANAALATAATPFTNATPSVATPTPALTPQPGATVTPALTATPGADQLAQAQQTVAPPTSITTGAPSTTTPTSVGAVVTRNWPWLLAALLAVGIGLFFVSRLGGRDRDQGRTLPPSGKKPVAVKETKTPELKPSSAATTAATKATTTGATGGAIGGTATGATAATGATPATGATSATTSATGATTATTGATGASAATTGATSASGGAAATGATAATAASLAASGKLSKKKKKKIEKAKRLAAENETKSGGSKAATTTGAATTATDATTTTGASTNSATTTTTDTGAIIAGGAIAATGAIIAGASAVGGAAAESEAAETKAIEVSAAETKAAEPPVAFDPERIESEIKKLLAGESYDEGVINATDEGTRQLVSAELMQAVAGRNAARQEHARTAFLKHGYFEEATRSLQSAEAPGERAAAARTLGMLGDRNATPHLTAALEDPAADVRRTSVEALAELRDPAAVGALEALRWRETSRQVPRTLIQRAIEASKVEEEEAAAVTASEVEDDTPTLVTNGSTAAALAETQKAGTTGAEAIATTTSETSTRKSATQETLAGDALAGERPTKEVELVYANPFGGEMNELTAESVSADAEEDEATVEDLTVESASLSTKETIAPKAPVAVAETTTVEEAATVAETASVETIKADEGTPFAEAAGTKNFAFTAPQVEPAPASEEATAEVETGTVEASVAAAEETPIAPAEEASVTHVESDLAATLAAKEASLIEARRHESELAASTEATEVVESPAASTADIVPPASFDIVAGADTAATELDTETQPVYRSDFAAGSGRPAAGDDDWIDLDADEQGVTIQQIEPAAPPAEPLGTFYAEGAGEWSATPAPDAPVSRLDETASLFDTLEVEAFETNAIELAPVVIESPRVESVRNEDAETKPLTFGRLTKAAAEEVPLPPRETEVVKAEKGLSLADGSDEDTYSIIPKGIQLRLTSEDASERAASVLALSRLNTDEAFNQICAAFDDPAEEVRNAAARAIYDLNEDRADSFTRALRESPVERRRQIGAALAGSGLAEEAIGNLTGESRDKTYDAFSLLFLMAKAGEVAPLIRAIESHHDNEVRLAVVKLLALSGQQEILPSFRRLAVRGSLPTEVRSAVMEAIYQISSQPNAPTPTA
ncbi:MAG: hypothetical protein QOD32_1227 [Pyrinomonadaceae bacterium]|jgi:HEAT repeat protein|nr:hypothetical protein [Pyrinomonadaceae bacterium]